MLARIRARLNDPQHRIAAHSLAGGLTGRVAMFAALSLYALIAPPKQFVTFSALYLVYQSALGIIAGPISTSTAQDAVARDWDRRSLTKAITRRALPIGMASAALCPIAVSSLLHRPLNLLDATIGGVIAIASMTEGLLGALAGRGLTAIGMRVEACRGLLTATCICTFGWLAGPHMALLTICVAEACVSMFAWRALRTLSHGHAETHPTHTRQSHSAVLKIGIITNVLIQLALIAQQSLMSRYWGEGIVAAFAVANRFASIVILLPTLLTRNSVGYLTRAASDSSQNFRQGFIRYATQVTVLTSIAALTGPIVAYAVFQSLMQKYPPSMSLTIILVIAGIPSAVGSALGTLCIVRHQYKTWLLSDVIFFMFVPVAVYVAHRLSPSPAVAAATLPIGYILIVVARLPVLRKVGVE